MVARAYFRSSCDYFEQPALRPRTKCHFHHCLPAGWAEPGISGYRIGWSRSEGVDLLHTTDHHGSACRATTDFLCFVSRWKYGCWCVAARVLSFCTTKLHCFCRFIELVRCFATGVGALFLGIAVLVGYSRSPWTTSVLGIGMWLCTRMWCALIIWYSTGPLSPCLSDAFSEWQTSWFLPNSAASEWWVEMTIAASLLLVISSWWAQMMQS